MKEMSERIETMDQISQNMDREFKSSRVVSPMHSIDERFYSFLCEFTERTRPLMTDFPSRDGRISFGCILFSNLLPREVLTDSLRFFEEKERSANISFH